MRAIVGQDGILRSIVNRPSFSFRLVARRPITKRPAGYHPAPHLYWLVLPLAATLAAYTASVTPERKAMLSRISAQSLQGHVSFLASDLLEGRDTPSRGLDLAAEYIASQFRRAGLEPVGDDGYFQTATLIQREPNWEGFEMTVTSGAKTIRIDKSEAYL